MNKSRYPAKLGPGAAEVFGGDLGQAYFGTQGDVWDAQKDSALALAGARAGRGHLRTVTRGASRLSASGGLRDR